MEDAPSPAINTPKETISDYFEIKQDDNNYKLTISVINQDITLDLLNKKDLIKQYEAKLTLNEIKQMHKLFSLFTSGQEFVDYIKAMHENNKILIKPLNENQISIELIVEYLFKQNVIKIELLHKKVNFDLVAQDLYNKISVVTENFKKLEMNYQKIVEENKNIKLENKNMKEKINILEEENKKASDRINNLENIINSFKLDLIKLKDINSDKLNKIILYKLMNSSIMEENEFDMINIAIKERMNKDIKNIKKIYQATKDGGDPETFHKKCDNIPNTLVLYKSAGNRRFGGFASECWKTKDDYISDKNCFLFSLDKKKIYLPKNKYYQIGFNSYDGPSFINNGFYCIELNNNALKNNSLKTYEYYFKDIFDGDRNALSEDGNFAGVYAKEYEVFQIEF